MQIDAGPGGAGELTADAGRGSVDSGMSSTDAGVNGLDSGVSSADSGANGPDSGSFSDSGTRLGDGGASDAGTRDAGGPFALLTLDSTARGTLNLAMAIAPSAGRVGVAYFTSDGGPDAELRYVEWHDGQVSAPQLIQVVQRVVGVSAAFDPVSKEPVVAFLGGSELDGGTSLWPQSDSVLARRSGLSGVWSQRALAIDSAPPMCSPIDQGYVVALWPSIAFDSTGTRYVAFRDAHNGTLPQQDWAASDVEVLEGASETTLTRSCLTGDHKQAYGGRIQLAVGASDQLGIVYDQAFGSATATGQNVLFQSRAANGSWSATAVVHTVGNTMTGASLAGRTDGGFAIAVTDALTSSLDYLESSSGTGWAQEVAAGSGTGGWYPSLAFDARYGDPTIAYYQCSPRNGISQNSCLQSEDALWLTERYGFSWHETMVDPAGGWSPKLGFLPNHRRVVAYRVPAALDSVGVINPSAGALKIAIER